MNPPEMAFARAACVARRPITTPMTRSPIGSPSPVFIRAMLFQFVAPRMGDNKRTPADRVLASAAYGQTLGFKAAIALPQVETRIPHQGHSSAVTAT